MRHKLLGVTCAAALLADGPALAELDRPHLNFYGMTGAIDMPTALDQPEGELAFTTGYFGNITRATLSFQALPAIQGAFRYTKYSGLDLGGVAAFEDYFDRSFDISVRLLKESRYLPQIKVGLQDFAGTGVSSAEYIVATKTFGGQVAVSAGLGWGRLGSYDPIGNTGTRDRIDIEEGGNFNVDQWFRGDFAPFASVIWQATPRLTLLAEYSSDAYTLETGSRTSSRILDRDNPFNFGATYRLNDAVTLGGYYLYGSELGVNISFQANPNRPPVVGSAGPAPQPLVQRPSRAAAPDKWVETWAANPKTQPALLTALSQAVEEEGIDIESFEVLSANAVEVRFRNQRYNSSAQAVGRVARALSATMPSSVETFRIVPSTNGIPASAVTIRRSTLETLVHAPNGAERLQSLSQITAADGPNPGASLNPELFPRFDWSLRPYARRVFFDPDRPLQFGVGLRAKATWEPRPGIVLSGSVTQRLADNFDDDISDSDSRLEPVRTNFQRYDEEGNPALERLTGAYYFKPGRDLYGRVTAGYLERMFGGISTEVLWKPVNSRLGVGLELNYVRQRDFDTQLGFQDYSVATGHVSAYYDLTDKISAQLDVGRYLAGDVGATLTLSRVFDNGWKVGVFATKTDVSAEDFGEGSFDKGISLEIPVSWLSGRPTKRTLGTTIRPVTRDGGARLNVNGRLFDQIDDYHREGLDAQWGRVWR